MRASSAPPRQNSASPPSVDALSLPGQAGRSDRIGERYRVEQELGRGGMAVVYRVLDLSSGQHMALKQLLVDEHNKNAEVLQRLFEHEFRTLAELDHPRVIHVDDYGVGSAGPYYTMELLDGDNLTQRAPVPWTEACGLMHDVCSSLALIHARHLLHRDVSPHNVRCMSTGRAKLIDFGAMVQMGPCAQPVGTPAFVAPEVAQRGTLDARTDLFSLGATLYFALTGRPAYPARSFEHLLDVWSSRPAPPSAYVPGIPARLDVLVMGLLSLEPAQRPRSAFEVMAQLESIAQLGEREVLEASRVYLSAPLLIERQALLARVDRRVRRARNRRGSGLLIDGAPGAGRSRALAAAVLQAKLAGLCVVHASAHRVGRQPFALVTEILHQLIRVAPEASLQAARETPGAALLFEPLAADAGSRAVGPLRLAPLVPDPKLRTQQQQALNAFCVRLARYHTFALAIDDIDDADEPSSAWLAGLPELAKRRRLLLLYTARRASVDDRSHAALSVIAERCARVTLAPFTRAQLESLCDSIFGNVPYVGLVADRVSRVAAGNARASMDLLRHLVAHDLIRYEGGFWVLPAELEPSALPASMDESYRARVDALSPAARWLAQVHALSTYAALTADDHARLMDEPEGNTSGKARAELLESEVLTGQNELTLADDAWMRALSQRLSDLERVEIHRKLARLGRDTQRHAIAVAYHFQCAGDDEQALSALSALPTDQDPLQTLLQLQLPVTQIAAVLQRGLDRARTHGHREFTVNELRRLCCGITVATQGDEYDRNSGAWLAALRRDAGLDDWDALADVAEPGQRLMQALTRASERYNAAPEDRRGYPPDVAIKQLISYVVISIALSSRSFDAVRMRSLPPLLEPFAALSPIIDAIYQNAIATYDYVGLGRAQRARERWIEVLQKLESVQGDALQYVSPIRGAIGYAIGLIELVRGYATATEWAALLDRDDMQRVNAMYLRRVARLQLGDVEGAERFRKKAELLAVAANSRQMFDSMLVPELIVFSMASDLTGLQLVAERLRSVAQRFAAWTAYERLARAQLALLHGAYDEALGHAEVALAHCEPDAQDPRRAINAWPWVVSARCHALLAAGRPNEAAELAARALAGCIERGMDATEELTRVLSLAQARLGDYAGASQRLEALIAQQEAANIIGLHLGASYEARTRIAIWASDREAVTKYGKLTAQAYAHGQGSPLGARYERLMSEAHSHGVNVELALTKFEASMFGTTTRGRTVVSSALANVTLRNAASAHERAERALRMICDATGAHTAQLHIIDRTGLRVVASLGAPHETGSYEDVARLCLERACDAGIGATQATSHALSSAAGSTAGHSTVFYEPPTPRAILLTGEHADELHHAAVVVLDPSARGITTRDQHELFAAIASYMLSVGDAPGVPAND